MFPAAAGVTLFCIICGRVIGFCLMGIPLTGALGCMGACGLTVLLGIYTSPMGFVSQLPRIWRAQPMKAGYTYEAVTSHAVIRSPRAPLAYMIDGDMHECEGALHVSIGPRVRIIVGT